MGNNHNNGGKFWPLCRAEMLSPSQASVEQEQRRLSGLWKELELGRMGLPQGSTQVLPGSAEDFAVWNTSHGAG